MKGGRGSRTAFGVLAALLLTQGTNRRRSGLEPRRSFVRPRPNRYLQGLNRGLEAERRRRQIARGYLRAENGLVKS